MKMHERYPRAYFVNQSERKFSFEGNVVGNAYIHETAELNDALLDLTGGITIAAGVHFGHRVMLLTTDHPPYELDGMKRRTMLRLAPIEIGENAYIGSGAIILRGVTIGKSAYIAAGSVVTKDIPDREVWAGSPAKKVRSI